MIEELIGDLKQDLLKEWKIHIMANRITALEKKLRKWHSETCETFIDFKKEITQLANDSKTCLPDIEHDFQTDGYKESWEQLSRICQDNVLSNFVNWLSLQVPDFFFSGSGFQFGKQ